MARTGRERECGLTAKQILVLELLRQNMPVPEIARRRGITTRAVYRLKASALETLRDIDESLAGESIDKGWIGERLSAFGHN